ncbi:hypothetical protein GCM10018785_01900 [Streptomyces longispororuber]|uniref:DUF3140 domain-containing protein n=1 Tax=Streptomyces longispororuber TaxID=68230 RepID=A0A918Z412_9ACTN|nr:DUF3140 domain-containing protein [Streptomyces longispororuber]GHE35838.1 hypothetical protein GCM10018785_01900 [Streptomyces longispororuber]
MADIPASELDELWEEFHAVVNMTSRELGDWLKTRFAGEDTEELPDQSGTENGRRVLEILGKRRVDLTDDDVRVMRKVVDTVTAERGVDLEPTAGQPHWRHRLMTLGHDPLKPPASDAGANRARHR